MPSGAAKPEAKKHPLKNVRAFQSALVNWFEAEGKSYPWRETTDAWAILVSEIMLQQTQVATVLGKGHYTRFMALYPTPRDMAEATEQEVLKAWEGLGYYRRARNLHAAAKAVTRNHGGHFPRRYEEIRALPGVGQYTAGAVASFAYNEPQPIVDANVARVFSRLFNFQERIDTSAGAKQLWQWATELVPDKNPRAYNSALMELGQRQCANKNPVCGSCPVRYFCHCSEPTGLPMKKSVAKVTRVDEFALFIKDDHGRILLEQVQKGERREGMWSLPRREHDKTLDFPLLLKMSYGITRYHVTLRVYACGSTASVVGEHESWYRLDDLENLPMPSPDRRALESILEG